jgi:hypothetical protein
MLIILLVGWWAAGSPAADSKDNEVKTVKHIMAQSYLIAADHPKNTKVTL